MKPPPPPEFEISLGDRVAKICQIKRQGAQLIRISDKRHRVFQCEYVPCNIWDVLRLKKNIHRLSEITV